MRQLRPILQILRSVTRQTHLNNMIVQTMLLTKELDCLLEHLIAAGCGKSADHALKCGGQHGVLGHELRDGAIAE